MILHSTEYACQTPGCYGDVRLLNAEGGHIEGCGVERARMSDGEKVTRSKFITTCGACGEVITLGTLIRRLDETWCHAECPEVMDVASAANGVCPVCWIARAVSGACGCDA